MNIMAKELAKLGPPKQRLPILTPPGPPCFRTPRVDFFGTLVFSKLLTFCFSRRFGINIFPSPPSRLFLRPTHASNLLIFLSNLEWKLKGQAFTIFAARNVYKGWGKTHLFSGYLSHPRRSYTTIFSSNTHDCGAKLFELLILFSALRPLAEGDWAIFSLWLLSCAARPLLAFRFARKNPLIKPAE